MNKFRWTIGGTSNIGVEILNESEIQSLSDSQSMANQGIFPIF